MAGFFKENLNATAVAAKSGNIDAAKKHQKDIIKKAWEQEIIEIGMPLPGDLSDIRVNFGIDDVLIWENGLALTQDDPINVRTIDNRMVEIPRDVADQVPALQREHYAYILQKKWQLQSAIDQARSIGEIFAIKW
ncbi:MAG: hypothetical protein ACOYJV_09315 [Aminivibrio sp.]|jgi:hypothetical protein